MSNTDGDVPLAISIHGIDRTFVVLRYLNTWTCTVVSFVVETSTHVLAVNPVKPLPAAPPEPPPPL
jgi:hypothetical protein